VPSILLVTVYTILYVEFQAEPVMCQTGSAHSPGVEGLRQASGGWGYWGRQKIELISEEVMYINAKRTYGEQKRESPEFLSLSLCDRSRRLSLPEYYTPAIISTLYHNEYATLAFP
jgi:hypothetical protein